MRISLMTIILSVATAYVCSAQLPKPLTHEQAKQMAELKNDLKALRQQYTFFSITPGIEQSATTKPTTPPFMPQQQEKASVPVDNIYRLASKMSVRQTENVFETAEFVFSGTTYIDYDLIQTMPYGSSFSTKLELYGAGNSDTTSNSVLSQPVKELSGVRLLFTSEVKDAMGTMLEFSTPFLASISLSRRDLNTSQLDVSISFITNIFKDIVTSGSLRMRILPPDEDYLFVKVPLNEDSKGRLFDMDGIKFKLSDYGPGDVVIAADTANQEAVDKWEYACRKNDQYLEANQTRSFWSDSEPLSIAPPPSFGKWLRDHIDISEYNLTRNMLEDDLKRTIPAAQADKFHNLVGLFCGSKMGAYLEKYNSEVHKAMVDTYEKINRGELVGTDWFFSITPDRDEFKQIGVTQGGYIAAMYENLNLKPNFEKIHLAIEAYSAKQTNDHTEINAQTDLQIKDIIARYRSLPLTLKDIADLFTPYKNTLRDDTSNAYSVWYKTNVDADTIVFYTQKPVNGELWILQSLYDIVSGECQSETSRTFENSGYWNPNLPLSR